MVESLTPPHGDAYEAALVDAAPVAPFQFLEINGFVYRCNKMTGEMWRLGVKAGDKKIQIWTLIEDAVSTH